MTREQQPPPYEQEDLGEGSSGTHPLAPRTSRSAQRLAAQSGSAALGVVAPDGRWLSANATLCALLQRSEEELVATTLEAVTHPGDSARDEAARSRLIASGEKSYDAETRLLRPNGESLLVQQRAYLSRDNHGRPLHFVVQFAEARPRSEKTPAEANAERVAHSFRALIEQSPEQIEARMLETEKLVSLGTLAAGVAHEINNPLTYILTNADYATRAARMATEKLRGGESLSPESVIEHLERVTEALERVSHGAGRVRQIVRDLRTFSRGDDDVRAPVDVCRVIESCLGMAAGEIQRHARLIAELRGVPPVIGNEARLGQVFLNLLINAAQAIPRHADPERNIVRVSTSLDEQAQVLVEVSDTGVGIEASILPRIFEPFFTTKPAGVGTGLGLSICHGIIQAHGGRIVVRSESGKGTTFRVTLPAARSERMRSDRPSAPRSASPRRGRVLVVDDERLVAQSVARLLETEYEVEVEVDPRRAIELLGSSGSKFDVVLCDVRMPGLTGPEIHNSLLSAAPEVASRIVLMTGWCDQATRETIDESGLVCLEKPLDVDRLFALLRERMG